MLKSKSTKDVSLPMILLCIFGYIFGFLYVVLSDSGIYLLINYFFGLACCIVMWYAYHKYRK